jgi:arylsulfatase A-like enzyme/Flp pilus assembly protein TadD
LLAALEMRRYGAGRSGSALLLHLLAACSGGATQITTTPVLKGAKPDVVVVTLDTTRADRLGAYGYKGAQTDTIDRLANQGIRFEHAYSPMPLTIPAHATMFTGLLPFHHNVRGNGDNVLAPEFTTLAEILRGQGWATAASVAAFVTTRQWGFSQGFGAYFDSMPEPEPGSKDKNYWHNERSGDLVVDDALNWLAGQPEDQPVFLWVHLYDAHYPYVARGAYAESMKDRPYDAELAYVDDQVGRLVEAFEGRNVLWALIGDHGESLGEHDEVSHGLFTYDATQHVPWIVSGAGVPAGVVTAPVSTGDLTPTLLKMLSVPVPDGLDGKPQPGTPVTPYSESYLLADRFRLAPHRTLVDGRLKLIATPKPELYDLDADPGETTNLAESRPDDVKRLQEKLAALGAAPPSATRAAMDAETVAQLAALGYVTGGGDDIDPLTLPDAKDYPEILKFAARFEQGKGDGSTPEQLLAEVDALLAKKPDAFEIRMRRLSLLARLERREEARVFAEETSAMFPTRSRVWLMLATMAMQDQDGEQALTYARKAVEADPLDAGAREAVVEALFRLGRKEDGMKEAAAALAADPKNYGVAAILGRESLVVKDFPNAERYLRLAVSGPNPRRAARSQLAIMALSAGARADAYNLLEGEVADYPGNRNARQMLSRMYAEDQRWLDQRDHIAFLARASPDQPGPLRALAQCLFNLGEYDGARNALDSVLELAPEDPDALLLNANLLAKEGKREEGLAMLKAANAANDRRIEAQKAAAAGKDPAKGGVPTPSAPAAPKPMPKAGAVPAGGNQ